MEKRKLHRNNLIYYLKVFSRETNTLLGHLVDITPEGIMLVSERAITENTIHHLRMQFPHDIFGEEELDFSALSLWSRPDINPDFFDTGFKLLNVPLEHVLLIKKLVNEYSFTY